MQRSPASSAFVSRLGNSSYGLVFDVGANTGDYSNRLMRYLRRATPHAKVKLTLVDPQASMAKRLGMVAAAWGGEFLPAAASNANGTVTFFTSSNSHVSSTVKAAASRYGVKRATTVPTFDLAALVLSRHRSSGEGGATRARAPIAVLLKLDVEACTRVARTSNPTRALCHASPRVV